MKRTNHIKSRAGFTMVEIMVVVGIMGVISMIAVPSFSKSRDSARVAEFVVQLQAIEHAMKLCAILNRGYPPNKYPRVVPAGGVDKRLPRSFKWSAPTPLGGNWNYDANAHSSWGLFYEYGISISSIDCPVMSEELFKRVDAQIDDGNLATGKFRKLSPGWHCYAYSFQFRKDQPWGLMY